MKTTIIKLAVIAVVVLAILVYVKLLQSRNQRLTEQVSLLTAINESNALELARLRYAAEITEQTITAWEADKKALDELRRGLNTQIQKELQTNEDFSDWASVPVPDSVNWMLNF